MKLAEIITLEVLSELGITDGISEKDYEHYQEQIEDIASNRIIDVLYKDLSDMEKNILEELTAKGETEEVIQILISSPRRQKLIRDELIAIIDELSTI